MPEMTVDEASRALRLHPSRIRALLKAGELRGRKIGGRWLADTDDVAGRLAAGPAEGRPFSPRRAWAYLLLLSGERAGWLDPATSSRLRARLRREDVTRTLPRLRRRAVPHYLRASPSSLPAIAASPGLMVTGVSAARQVDAPLVARDQLDAYVPERVMRGIVYRFALEAASPALANVILRIPSFAPPLRDRAVAPAGAVAVDLLESPDQRTRRAGEHLAERLRADRHRSDR